MDKKSILKNFGEDDRAEIINLFDKYELAKDRDIPIFGNNFYTPNIWRYFQEKLSDKNFKIEVCGGFEESERRMISFNNTYDIPFPMKMIKIVNKSKFSNQGHRDYLGALLALGIKRNKIGDLLVVDNECYLPVCEEIHHFILNNLESVGKSPCIVETLENGFTLPEANFTETVIMIPSLRIDSIVSKIAKTSRAKAQDMIDEGKVLKDYNSIKNKAEEVTKGERITIRGIGKFILGDIIGNTKSGKFKVVIKKYT